MLHVTMKQYALKIVINKFKEQGKAAVTKEPTQLHDLEIFTSVDSTKLNKRQIAEVVASLMFLKETIKMST